MLDQIHVRMKKILFFVRIMKKELEYTKEQLESFINHHMDAVIITDLEGQILRVNEAYEKVYGWKSHEVIGKNITI
ncbi:PAS domain S-box protein [Priestia megaterium]|uniref:PAS domain S-box protein n=1 Tax=Priestia megaterium TaxID=1404 RepID=UPI0030EE90E8